jgi:glutathione S-transferase
VKHALTSHVATMLRGASGRRAQNPRADLPSAEDLELYEFEGCPFCRKVREMLTFLDLEVTVYPCPKGGERYRPKVVAAGGKAQFPYLIDRQQGVRLYESDAIIEHLAHSYGDGRVPLALRLGPLTTLTASLAGLVRGAAGTFARPARSPARPLVLYASEACVESRPVREALSVFEIPYVLRNVGVGSRRRAELAAKTGGGHGPLLCDPNSGETKVGADSILAHLRRAYAS